MENIRKVLGTEPGRSPKVSYEVVKGCSRLKVLMISYPRNPYFQICEAVLQTWGEEPSHLKWNKLSPEARYLVVKAALTGNTLPLALETPSFQFQFSGIPRWVWDQLVRSRIGFTFFSIGVRDNLCSDRYLIIHPKEYNNPEVRKRIEALWREIKDTYMFLCEKRKSSWQNARDILPMGMSHQGGFSANYLALKNYMSRRLAFCEAHHHCGLAWTIRKRIEERFPLLANYLRPACDFVKKCLYQKNYYLSNAFGMLFRTCGRNPAEKPALEAEFNEAAADKEELEKELGFKIPGPEDYFDLEFKEYKEKFPEDAKLFEENF